MKPSPGLLCVNVGSFKKKLFVSLFWCVLLTSKAFGSMLLVTDSIALCPDVQSSKGYFTQQNLERIPFFKAANNRINFGLAGSQFKCFMLKLTTTARTSNRVLSIDNTSLDALNVYSVLIDGTIQLIYRAGNMLPFDKTRTYIWHSIPLELNEKTQFYFIALKAGERNINVRYEILEKEQLQRNYRAYDRFVFFYLGIAVLTTVVILLAFLLFRKREFAEYLGYMICSSLWILSHYGYVFPFLYPDVPLLNEIVKPVSSLGACFFLLRVVTILCRGLLKNRPKLKKAIYSLVDGLVILMIASLALMIPDLPGSVKLCIVAAWHLGLMLSILVLMYIPLIFFSIGLTSKIFSMAVLVMCIMIIAQFVGNLGLISDFILNEHGSAIGSLAENTIMAFGLFSGLLDQKKSQDLRLLALEQEQNETLKKLIEVQDIERRRIANDLHDTIGPLLAALKINFRRVIQFNEELVENSLISKTESIIDDSVSEIRSIAQNLMPKGISSNGLINTLKTYFESIQLLNEKDVQFYHEVNSSLNKDLQIHIYRIVCELVLNATRHSHATQIKVSLITDESTIKIGISDNGKGFRHDMVTEKKSLGLKSAESRVLYLKGKFLLKSEIGKGTEIEMEIPLQFDQSQVYSLQY